MMKRTTIVALVAAQIAATAPAHAADLDSRGAFMDDQRGGFAGVRIRARLGGGADPEIRAALTVAPTIHSRSGGTSRMNMGDGLELGVSPGSRPTMTLAGRQLDRMNLFGPPPREERTNLSTVATVAIVAGVVLVVGAVAFTHVMNEASCFHGGSDGDC